MEKITWISLICLFNFGILTSQEVFESKKVHLNQKDSLKLDELLHDYTAIELDVEKFHDLINSKEISKTTIYVSEKSSYNLTLSRGCNLKSV